MKRYVFIGFFVTLFVAFLANIFNAQIGPSQRLQKFYNSSSVTIRSNKLLKWDTTWTLLMRCDTQNYVYQEDTSGNAKTYQGRDSAKGQFADTLSQKDGDAFNLCFDPLTTPSTDSIFIYGTALRNPMASRTDSGAQKDTVICTNDKVVTQYLSKYVWTDLDSFRFRTKVNGVTSLGSDSFYVYYRVYDAAKLSDSLSEQVAGVSYGPDLVGTYDTIKTATVGFMVIEGDIQVYVEANKRPIRKGDFLSVSENGKVQLAFESVADTVRPCSCYAFRYVSGARLWDPVIVTPIRRADTAGGFVRPTTASDTLAWKAYVRSNDTISFVAHSINSPACSIKESTKDSLSYIWIPRGLRTAEKQRIIGKALEPCDTDSTLKWIRLFPNY